MPTPAHLTRAALADLESRLFRARMEIGYLEKNPSRITTADSPEHWRQVIAEIEAQIADVKSQRERLDLDRLEREERDRGLERAKQGVADLAQEVIAGIRAKRAGLPIGDQAA